MKFKVEYPVELGESEQDILLKQAEEYGLAYPLENDKVADKRTILKRLFEKYGTQVRGMK